MNIPNISLGVCLDLETILSKSPVDEVFCINELWGPSLGYKVHFLIFCCGAFKVCEMQISQNTPKTLPKREHKNTTKYFEISYVKEN